MGPGFNQTQPRYRLGDPKKIPAIDSKYKIYDSNVSTAVKIYAFIIGTHANILFEAAQVHLSHMIWAISYGQYDSESIQMSLTMEF